MLININEINIPDSKLTKEATELVRDTTSELIFHHSSRVYYWGAIAGRHRNVTVNHELLYIACMFHDLGLFHKYSSHNKRFEVDSADVARDFLRSHAISEQEINLVWAAIALHTTPGIPEYMDPLIALVTTGVEMDVLGIDYEGYDKVTREAVLNYHPRTDNFKEDIIQAFYDGIQHKPETTFGNVKADVFADKDPKFKRLNFCDLIRHSSWPA